MGGRKRREGRHQEVETDRRALKQDSKRKQDKHRVSFRLSGSAQWGRGIFMS